MGKGISQLVASKGLDVVLIEKDEICAKKALEGITRNIDKEIARWTMTNSEKKNILNRITVTAKLEDAAAGDMVIESIPENLELKRELFKKLDQICPKNTILLPILPPLALPKSPKSLNDRKNLSACIFFIRYRRFQWLKSFVD